MNKTKIAHIQVSKTIDNPNGKKSVYTRTFQLRKQNKSNIYPNI